MALLIEDYLQVLPNYTFPDRIIQKAMGAYDIAEHTHAFPLMRGHVIWPKQLCGMLQPES